MDNKKVLVTGGLGFVGSNLVYKLLKTYKNIDITILDNMYSASAVGVRSDMIDFCDNGGYNVNIIFGGTYNIDEIFNNESDRFDIIFHFGEYSRIVPSFKDIDYLIESNLKGTANVVNLARKWKSQLVYSASSSTFGNNGEDRNLTPYSFFKDTNVSLIRNYMHWYGLNADICYFFNVYGPGQIETGDYATVVGIFEEQYRKGEELSVVYPGTQTRDFTHIDDIVDGVIKAAVVNGNRSWYLRSGENVSLIDLASMFNTKFKFIPSRRGERIHSPDFNPDANIGLDWKPTMDLRRYIADVTTKIDLEFNGN